MTTVLFIGGYGRSGSTMLDRVLGESPGVTSLGEVRHLWREGLVENRRCGCGKPFQSCAHWDAVLARAFGPEGVDVERVRALQHAVDRWWRVPQLARSGASPQLREYAGALSCLYRAAAAETGAQILVDSSKDVSHGYVLRHLDPDLELRVVHLLRDPRAVAYSWQRHKHNPGSGRPMDRWPPWRTAIEWDVINAGVAGLRRLGEPYLPVSYEDLTAAPRGTVERVLRFAGQRPPQVPVAEDGTVELAASHTAAGNPDRFRSGPTQIRSDARWRTGLRTRDRLAVAALCAPGLARLR